MTEKEGVLQHFDKQSGALPYNHIRHIYEDSDGIFWLATEGSGLIKWQPNLEDPSLSQYEQFSTKN